MPDGAGMHALFEGIRLLGFRAAVLTREFPGPPEGAGGRAGLAVRMSLLPSSVSAVVAAQALMYRSLEP
jgi:hypothetical protein